MAACTGDLYVDYISRTECIGNSLVTINKNFATLDSAVCDANNLADSRQSTILGTALSQVANGRLSLSDAEAVVTTDIYDANFIYYHPYNGNKIALWNVDQSKWEVKTIPGTISKQLLDCTANTNYDVFIYLDGIELKLETVPWTNSNPGALPPILPSKDGVLVKPLESNKRLIGCIRTTDSCLSQFNFGKTAVQGGSDPKFLVWNANNRVPHSFAILDSGVNGGWTTTSGGANAFTDGPFEHFGGGNGNRISFISREITTIDLNSCYYVQSSPYIYFVHSIDRDTPTVGEYILSSRGLPIFQAYGKQGISHSTHTTLDAGYHFVQLAVMTEPNQRVSFNVWKNNRYSGSTAGYLTEF